MFMVFKIIHCCLFRKIENKINSKEKELFDKELAKAAKSCFGKVTFFFRQNSFTEILLISFIEANCIFISFYCALQLKLVFFFNFFDKLICLFCIYFCFICLLSSLSFYLLFYGLKPRKGKNFIEYKINVKNAYFS